jgi:transcriptional regulator with XRE-family HTH domain
VNVSTERVPDLAEVIEMHRERTADSYADIASKTGLSKGAIHRLATAELDHVPRPDTIRALARGMGVPESVIRDAALASVGLIVTPTEGRDSRYDALYATFTELDEHDQQVAEDFLASLHKRRRR